MQQINEAAKKRGWKLWKAKIIMQYRRSGSEEVEKEKRGREAKILDTGRSLHLQPEAATAEMYAYSEQGCQLEPIAEASWISRVYIDCNMFPGILQSAKMNEAISFLHEKEETESISCSTSYFQKIGQESAMRKKSLGSFEDGFDRWQPFGNMESVQFLREHSAEDNCGGSSYLSV
ncbi:MAG: hypothetical protein ACLRUZ_11690 [Faecalimonas sp.]